MNWLICLVCVVQQILELPEKEKVLLAGSACFTFDVPRSCVENAMLYSGMDSCRVDGRILE